MAETILVPAGLLSFLVIVGVVLYAAITKLRAQQDRRDYAAAAPDHLDDEVGAEGAASGRREPPEVEDRRA